MYVAVSHLWGRSLTVGVADSKAFVFAIEPRLATFASLYGFVVFKTSQRQVAHGVNILKPCEAAFKLALPEREGANRRVVETWERGEYLCKDGPVVACQVGGRAGAFGIGGCTCETHCVEDYVECGREPLVRINRR